MAEMSTGFEECNRSVCGEKSRHGGRKYRNIGNPKSGSVAETKIQR